MKVQSTNYKISRVILYAVLIVFAFLMLVPFAWMVSASLKLDKDVFIFPIQWIPENPIRRKYGQNHFNRYMFTAAHQQLRSVCICKTEFQA